jgi:hypothetical protein
VRGEAVLHLPGGRRVAPFVIDSRTLRAWMRGADLKAPSWKNSAIHFATVLPTAWPPVPADQAKFAVSTASVRSARRIADTDRPRSVETKPVWKEPAEESIDYMTQFFMMMDDELTDKISVASRRRIYTDDETRTAERWNSALHSVVKYDAMTPHGTELLSRDEQHKFDLWPFITERAGANQSGFDLKVRPLTLQETEYGFARMTALAIKMSRSKELKKIVSAKTASARAYQGSEFALRLYRFGDRRIIDAYLLAARIVYQQVSFGLKVRDLEKRVEQLSRGRRKQAPSLLVVGPFMLAPGVSSYDAESKFDRDASVLRELLNDGLERIEERFGGFCNALVIPPQTGIWPCYNGIKDRKKPAPLADRILSAVERADLVAEYLDKADSFILRPMVSEDGIRWLRAAYRLIAHYLELGGRILTGYGDPVEGLPAFIVDGRSAAQVLEAGFSGSRFRDIGLDPFNQQSATTARP